MRTDGRWQYVDRALWECAHSLSIVCSSIVDELKEVQEEEEGRRRGSISNLKLNSKLNSIWAVLVVLGDGGYGRLPSFFSSRSKQSSKRTDIGVA